MTRLIVFDVDGTLVDSQHAILAAMRAAFASAGRPVPERARILGVVGLSLPEAMRVLVPRATQAEACDLAERYRASVVAERAAGRDRSPLYPGARAALARLNSAPGTRLGVATGKARRGLDHLFAAHDLGGFFATAQTADAHPSKPHPAMLDAALAETGCAAGAAVMVGDTEFDIAMGRAAGMATVGVSWGYHPRDRLAAAGAGAIVDDFASLDAALAAVAR